MSDQLIFPGYNLDHAQAVADGKPLSLHKGMMYTPCATGAFRYAWFSVTPYKPWNPDGIAAYARYRAEIAAHNSRVLGEASC